MGMQSEDDKAMIETIEELIKMYENDHRRFYPKTEILELLARLKYLASVDKKRRNEP